MMQFLGTVTVGILLLSTVIADECEYKQTDIVFVLDESGSISSTDFAKEVQFIDDLVSLFKIGPNDNQVGAMTFNSGQTNHFYLNKYDTLAGVESGIASIGYSGGGTHIPNALSYMRTQMFASSNGARNNVNKVAIVLSDGVTSYQDELAPEVVLANADGIVIITIGIGTYLNHGVMKSIAHTPNHFFPVENFSELEGLVAELGLLACAGCIYQKTDTVFVLDESGSISLTEFNEVVEFLDDMVSLFNIGPNDNQVGAMTFNHGQTKHFQLDEYSTLAGVESGIASIGYSGGGTHIPDALYYMRTHMFASARGARANVNKVAFVISDGYTSDFTNAPVESAAARGCGIIIIGIGVGTYVNHNLMREISHTPNHYFHVNDFSELKEMLAVLGLLACADNCPGDWEKVFGNCYRFVSCPLLNQDDALEACDVDGGDLLRIDSLDELDAVRAHIQGDPMLCYPKYWTAAYEPNNDGNWYWRDFGGADIPIPSTELYWGINEPNELHNDREHCINLLNLHGRDYYYNDAICNRKMGYICKITSPSN